MDLTRLELDLSARRARLTIVDAAGGESQTVEGDAWAPIETAAAALLAAVESTIGGACHLGLHAIAIDPAAHRLSVHVEGEPAARDFAGAAYDALTGGGRAVGELSRVAVAQLGRRRGDRSGSPSEASFWSRAYREPAQGWELMRPAPPLERWLKAHPPSGKRALVVGCGRGHEARLLAALGAQVVAIDFAPEALDEAKRLAAADGARVDFRQRDLFDLGKEPDRYDLIVEHCCFCAIDPARRDEYARVVSEVLADGGELVGLFWEHGRPGGPPFSVTRDEVAGYFSPRFTIDHVEVPPDSVALRAGQELLFHMRRR